MDRDKDFIHIDKLFKRLEHNEEPMHSGSWLRMKSLLDEKLPLGQPVNALKPMRRYIAPVLLLLAMGAGTAAYYGWMRNDKEAPEGMAHYSTPSTDYTYVENRKQSAPQKSAATVSDHQSVHTADRKKEIAGQSKISTVHEKSAITPGRSEGISPASPSGHNPVKEHIVATTSNNVSTERNNKGNKQLAGVTTESRTAKETDGLVSNKTVIERKVASPSGNLGANIPVKEPVTNNNETSGWKESDNAEVAGKMARPVTVLNGNRILKSEDGTLYKEEKDSIKRIEIIERYSSTYTAGKHKKIAVPDTVAVARVERVRYVPLDKLEMQTLEKWQSKTASDKVIPLAERKTVLNAEWASLIPLDKYKVSSRKVDPQKFNDLIRSTTSGIANYFDGSHKLYAAFFIGGNAVIGNPGAFGLQAGIAALYSLGERVSMALEFRLANRNFSNYTMVDKSTYYDNIKVQPQDNKWLFSGTEHAVVSSYKLNNYYALSIPLTISYNLGRVSVFGGLNVEYAFPFNWNKQTSTYSVPVEQVGSTSKNPFANVSSTIDPDKVFASRWGLGYVGGLSYDFSKNVSVDARVSHVLTSKAVPGGTAVDRVFRMPDFQISLGYFFGRKDKVVYIMDRN